MFLEPKTVLKHLPLTASAKVGDFGTGAGHYALAAAERIGAEGAVYAFDAFGPSLDALLKEAERYPSPFYALRSDLNTHIPLKDDLLDAAIVANVFSQVSKRGRFAGELARVVKPGGTALVIDWVTARITPSSHEALTPAEAARTFRAAGFVVGEMLPAGTHHFAFLATAPKNS